MTELENIMIKLIERIDYAKPLDFTTKESKIILKIVNEHYANHLDDSKKLVKKRCNNE